MAVLNNFGIIQTQSLIEEFEWNKKQFYSYLITFKEYDGYFRIVRQAKHEQALIGAKMIFNYSSNEEKIVKYRIIGFEEQLPIKELSEKSRKK
jgi:hypothetical protein